ncbi:MAG: AraC family transcriptional regulator [Spirochaetaceae bacterium]|jgi:AraC-like DNA-binding protein/quercetin dioxygenase-like cupin family protein|nr:AraC family transcriptional regulator [Spirochaetaceae bacterium]
MPKIEPTPKIEATPKIEPTVREKKRLGYDFPFLLTDVPQYSGFPPHWHDCFEILYILKGRLLTSINEGMHEVEPGDIVLINAGTTHGFFQPSPGAVIRIVQFDMSFFDNSFMELRGAIFDQEHISRRALEAKQENVKIYIHLQTVFNDMAREFRLQKAGWQIAVRARMDELMLVLLRDTPVISPEDRHNAALDAATVNPYMKQLQAFLFGNYSNPDLSLDDAAERVQLSKFYFTRFFRKQAGMPFHVYLTAMRVNFAKHYLAESEMPIIDVAFDCGFGSLQTFNRVFKEQTEMTPSQYRNQTKMPYGSALVQQHFGKKGRL